MILCQYQVQSPLSAPNLSRLGIILQSWQQFQNNQKECQILDPQSLWQIYFTQKGHYHTYHKAKHKIPNTLASLLKHTTRPLELLQESLELYQQNFKEDKSKLSCLIEVRNPNIKITKPLDPIGTYRDFFSFEEHVKKGFEKRNEAVPKAWYEIPVYYKGSSHTFIDPEEEILWPKFSDKLDYELEFAAIIGRDGKNIKKEKAWDHIFGYSILNDISARDLQKKEMSVRLGPSKSKDFCSILGPVIITKDEFPTGMPKLKMQAKINGHLWSEGLSSTSYYNFAQMIEYCSQEEWLLAGDIIGSGTVGTGCGLELDKWIAPGDQIELSIEGIGTLRNKVGQKNG